MFNTITNTITNTAAIVADIYDRAFKNAEIEVFDADARRQLESDALEFCNDVICDGINDAVNSEHGFVAGHFETTSGKTVFVEIEFIDGQSGDEFIFTIGGFNWERVVVQDESIAIAQMFDYVMAGV